ncbi:MAG TPA: hypothetical protein VGQ69_00640 [Gemmatimonadales bacterium]|jgi:hypothetical protein|nr:hypothetical protein [Gemmatimonadales bacterium]
MGLWLGVAVLCALLVRIFIPLRRAIPAPEDDVATPIDKAELAEAERELESDPDPRSLEHADHEDDWGPGAG